MATMTNYSSHTTTVNQFGGGVPVVNQPVSIQHTTVVVNQQPPPAWHSGLMSCCEDMGSCCLACLCGNWYFGCIASRMGESYCVGLCGHPGGCVQGGHLAMRSSFRNKHGIPGSICSDFFAVSCCLPCVMCQLSREMDSRGYQNSSCC